MRCIILRILFPCNTENNAAKDDAREQWQEVPVTVIIMADRPRNRSAKIREDGDVEDAPQMLRHHLILVDAYHGASTLGVRWWLVAWAKMKMS